MRRQRIKWRQREANRGEGEQQEGGGGEEEVEEGAKKENIDEHNSTTKMHLQNISLKEIVGN